MSPRTLVAGSAGSIGQFLVRALLARDVAAAIAAALTTDGHDGQSYVLTGPQSVSYADLAALLSAALSRPIRYVDLPTESFHEHLLGNGVPAWEADDLAGLGRLLQAGRTWPVTSTVAELTGRPATRSSSSWRSTWPRFGPDTRRCPYTTTRCPPRSCSEIWARPSLGAVELSRRGVVRPCRRHRGPHGVPLGPVAQLVRAVDS